MRDKKIDKKIAGIRLKTGRNIANKRNYYINYVKGYKLIKIV